MVPSRLSDSGGRTAVRRMGLLLTGGVGIALLPLAAQAQMGRSFSYSQPVFRGQMGLYQQGYAAPMQPNRGGFTGPRMMPGSPGMGFPHYGMGSHPGIFRHNGGTAPQFGLFSGAPVPQNYGLFGPGTPRYRNQVPGDFTPPGLPADRGAGRFLDSAPPPFRSAGPYRHTGIIGTGPFDRFHALGEYFIYDNGVYGRAHCRHYHGWYGSVFPEGLAFYPFYALDYLPGVTCLSPYAYYLGAFPGYISAGYVNYAPPPDAYVPTPLYAPDGAYQGYPSDGPDDSALSQVPQSGYRIGEQNPPVPDKPDDGLKAAVDDIQKAWQDRNIQLLVKHLRSDAQVAVYLRGKYQYSLDSGDYGDMTRDAFHATKTVSFTLDGVQRKEDGVYVVTGRHLYKDKDGAEHTVHVSYVLERTDGGYYITQVGTDPDKAVSLPGDEDKAPKAPVIQGDAAPPATAPSGDAAPDTTPPVTPQPDDGASDGGGANP